MDNEHHVAKSPTSAANTLAPLAPSASIAACRPRQLAGYQVGDSVAMVPEPQENIAHRLPPIQISDFNNSQARPTVQRSDACHVQGVAQELERPEACHFPRRQASLFARFFLSGMCLARRRNCRWASSRSGFIFHIRRSAFFAMVAPPSHVSGAAFILAIKTVDVPARCTINAFSVARSTRNNRTKLRFLSFFQDMVAYCLHFNISHMPRENHEKSAI